MNGFILIDPWILEVGKVAMIVLERTQTLLLFSNA